MTDALTPALERALADRDLLAHPFYRRWEAGQLSRDEIARYAEQYRHFEAMLPVFLRELADRLPAGTARDAVLANLADEVAAPSHLELFDRFADAVGAAGAPASPAMARLVATYSELLDDGLGAALAGLWAYESQGGRVAESKARGLRDRYRAGDAALEFWWAHDTVEDQHAEWTREALGELEPDAMAVERGARAVADAWWSFLDERELAAA